MQAHDLLLLRGCQSWSVKFRAADAHTTAQSARQESIQGRGWLLLGSPWPSPFPWTLSESYRAAVKLSREDVRSMERTKRLTSGGLSTSV